MLQFDAHYCILFCYHCLGRLFDARVGIKHVPFSSPHPDPLPPVRPLCLQFGLPGSNMHAPNEHFKLSMYRLAREAYVRLFFELAEVARAERAAGLGVQQQQGQQQQEEEEDAGSADAGCAAGEMEDEVVDDADFARLLYEQASRVNETEGGPEDDVEDVVILEHDEL